MPATKTRPAPELLAELMRLVRSFREACRDNDEIAATEVYEQIAAIVEA